MKATVIGKESISYKKKTGEQVEGIKLYLAKKPPVSSAMSVQGMITFDEWISKASDEAFKFCMTVPVNSEVELDYEVNGKYANLVAIKKAI